ncbi:peroxisomal membrane anchor protein conserved region-domain-containing protein [Colletotrichum navitas]|uniref:Peroxisomal membrane protein PEX14 n=1 Tax=Colletotrichum navitas TaxID=681940 RepID=A0AAD8VA75_9PEZI|nr:peroxisomal membrane anchor protein conserved region-domain-containing protein [Colletotrichum navitas]KAK1597636.1 peroxisomal membrane anchor protein conserved region-domain-containing protein [Colletotrichum navitas]
MSDSDDNKSTPGIPEWQRDQKTDAELEPQTQQPSQDAVPNEPPRENSIEIARKFLQDDEIKDAPREAKEAFLKTKGISSTDIEQLLGSSVPEPAHDTTQTERASASSTQVTATTPKSQEVPTPPPNNEVSIPRQIDQPPVVTYPEFLTKSTRPPPLVTANGILNTLCAFAGLSTLLYGTSKYVVAPMVETLTEARCDLHDTTSKNLAKIIEKLEGAVSEVPAPKATAGHGEAYRDDVSSSSADDPTEMFHRDIGTQTSVPPTPRLGEPGFGMMGTAVEHRNRSASDWQADKLARLKSSADLLKTTVVSDAEDLADLKSRMDVLKDDLVQLAYPSPQDYGSYSLYGGPRKNEPEDEIKKARDNIRRVKGVLLSTRNFPASPR